MSIGLVVWVMMVLRFSQMMQMLFQEEHELYVGGTGDEAPFMILFLSERETNGSCPHVKEGMHENENTKVEFSESLPLFRAKMRSDVNFGCSFARRGS